VYVKISPDITQKERKDIAALAFKHRVDGFICGNLTKNRTLDSIYETELPNTGGLSGKVVENVSNELLSDMYTYTKGQKTIIGLGGIFTAEDAYIKIKLGASLVQIITGLIYQGPQTVGEINYNLSKLIRNDGYTNISQAIGTMTL
jgi:dihydroorotate dehydrogenase